MKTVRSICLLLSLLASATCAQLLAQFNVYHPFPDSNAVWGMGAGCYDGNCGTYRYVQHYYAGDTIIEGSRYKMVHEAVSMAFGECTCGIPEDMGAGYLREDTAGRKVYWRIPGSNADSLLFDFTLELGDTLKGLYGSSGLCSEAVFTVQSIDSIQVGGSFRKRINFTDIYADPCQSTSMIEGVGSTNGLTACYATPAQFGITLECFTVNGEVLYTAPCGGPDLTACGELPTGLQDPDFGLVQTVVPNPSTGLFNLGQPAQEVQVYNAQGKLLFRQKGNEVDLGAEPPGVYSAVMETAKGRRVERLVVVR